MAEEEWTFVPPRKGPKRRPARRPNATNPQAAGGGGLYGAARASDVGRQGAEGARDVHPPTEEEQRKERERIKGDVLECLRALEEQLQSRRGFASRLLSAMAMASEATEDGDGGATKTANAADHATIAKCDLRIREIVAYGIGNFATGRYHAPMLQLACLLLLRRCACQSTHQTQGGNVSDAFEREQRQVPIYYYEPCTLPVEKALLENVFHLTILDTNEMGKRTVESMRQPQKAGCTEGDAHHTLFYMPHCPMRLYCNVLWAHWDRIFPITTSNDGVDGKRNNPILIFGNSFGGYDEGLISSEKRSDPTNGLLRVLPSAREMTTNKTASTSRRRSDGEIIPDSLRHLEMAFNDCNVISFSVLPEDAETRWPDRPEEWDASRGTEENGELKA
ncbi:hypothetical protein ACHAXT_001614 [Thalassiosira profunda]